MFLFLFSDNCLKLSDEHFKVFFLTLVFSFGLDLDDGYLSDLLQEYSTGLGYLKGFLVAVQLTQDCTMLKHQHSLLSLSCVLQVVEAYRMLNQSGQLVVQGLNNFELVLTPHIW